MVTDAIASPSRTAPSGTAPSGTAPSGTAHDSELEPGAASTVNLESKTVQRIIRAAGACFGRKGFRGASMNEVSREAGVSKSLLHYHFESKEQLLLQVQLHLLRDLLDQVRGLTEGGQRSIAQFNRALEEVLSFLERELDTIIVILELHKAAADNPRIASAIERFNDELQRLVVGAIENILGPLVDRLLVPPDRLALMLRTFFNGLIVELAFARHDEKAREQVLRTFDDVRALFTHAVFAQTA